MEEGEPINSRWLMVIINGENHCVKDNHFDLLQLISNKIGFEITEITIGKLKPQ